MADPGELRTHVADLHPLDARDAIQEVLAELGQGVAVGGGQADAGDDDAGGLHCGRTEIASQPAAESNTSLDA